MCCLDLLGIEWNVCMDLGVTLEGLDFENQEGKWVFKILEGFLENSLNL